MIEESYKDNPTYYESNGQSKTSMQWLEDYTDAIEAYNDALLLDDSSKIDAAKSEFEALDLAIQDLIANNPGFAYFASMFEDVRSALNDSAVSADNFGNSLKNLWQETDWLKNQKVTATQFASAFIDGLGKDQTSRAIKNVLQEYADAFSVEFEDLSIDQVEWVADYLTKSGVLVQDASDGAAKTVSTSHSLKDYMTFDENGSFTSKGAWDFVEDVNKALGDGFASKGEDDIWNLDLTGDKLQAVADAFGTATEFVELMGKALTDAGMDVQFDPKDVQDYRKALEELNEEAKVTHEELEALNIEGINLDCDQAEMSIDEINSKIQELTDKKNEIDISTIKGQKDVDALNAEISSLEKNKVMLSIGAEIDKDGGASIEELLSLDDEALTAKLNIDASQAETARSMLESMQSESVEVPVTVRLDEGQFSTLTAAEGTANYTLGDYPTEVPDVSGTANYSGIFPTRAPTIQGTVVYSGSYPKGAKSSGSMLSVAHADGTAYNVLNYKRLSPSHAGGRVSLPSDEDALTNEVGKQTANYKST